MYRKQSVLLALTFWICSGTVAIAQGSCAYALNAGGQAFTQTGGSGNISISAPPGCDWTIAGTPGWVILMSSAAGSGNSTVTYQVTLNTGMDRSATMTVAGVGFTVEQEAGGLPGLGFIGSMAHIAAAENWTTAFTLVNKDTISAIARLSFFGDAIDPGGNGSLTLPIIFPLQPLATLPLLTASFDRTVPPNASLIVNTAAAQTSPLLVGSAQLVATGSLDGFAIFHQIVTKQEAVVPLETRSASSYLLPFDNTGGLTLGVAIENVSSQGAAIPVVIRDDTGAVIGTPGATIALGGHGHTSFVLSNPGLGFPVTANKRGTIEFDTPAGGRISVLGLRFTPPNNALTTIPAMANVGTNGGSVAHLATGNGWQTTFVLVNAGASSAQVNLNFFADNGSTLALPLSFPQTGGATTTVASTVNQLIAGGATLIVQSAAPLSDPAPTVGSAQLTTNGHVGGFVIFRYNPAGQEAVVPIEGRNAGSYIVPFDNTADISTGIAINSVAAQVAIIPVTVRDASGAQIATDTITLAPNGHLAFTLGTDKYPSTAGIRGTIEFNAPANTQIGVLGIRIPAIAHTFTTLPALAK